MEGVLIAARRWSHGLDAENREQLDMGTVARSAFFHLPARLQVRDGTEVVYDPVMVCPLTFLHFDGRRPLTSPGLKRVKIHSSNLLVLCMTLSTPVLYS